MNKKTKFFFYKFKRGRDHGLPGYTAYRRFCNMSHVNDFEDLKIEISNKDVRKMLKKLYGHTQNIDLWIGGILEDVLPDSKVGPLFMCIIIEQMKVIRDGDRFWYENKGVFTPVQLAEIKKTTLAKIICENGDNINRVQRDVFLNAKFPQEMLKCSDLTDISLEPWRNCCKENINGLCAEPAYYYVPADSKKIKKRSSN
jgi:peroxidase